MKLEKQVTSLKLSKKLKELGVKQESVWYWNKPMYKPWKLVVGKSNMWEEQFYFSAFTVAELGEINSDIILWIRKWGKYPDFFVSGKAHGNIKADTEANARATMLICLIENNLINKRKKRDK